MRILVTTTSYPSVTAPFNGVFIRAHARALAARGHDVRVLVPHVFAADPAEETDGHVTVTRVPYGSDQKLLSDHARIPLALVGRLVLRWNSAARAAAVNWRPDVVHGHWAIPSGIPARVAARKAAAPLVLTVHRADVELAVRRPSTAGRLMRGVLSDADAVIAVSEELAARLSSDFGVSPLRIQTIPMGVDTELFSPRSRQAARRELGLPLAAGVVLAVGAHIPRKRFDDVIESMRVVRDTYPDAQLLLAGDGPDSAKLQRIASEMGVAEAVRFLGAVDQKALPSLLHAADAVVLASEDEGLPVVLMEAAAAGVPCVATDVGGSSEVVRLHPLGRLVAVGDVSAIAAGVMDVLATQQRDVRESVLAPRSRFTMHGAIERVEAVYRTVLQEDR